MTYPNEKELLTAYNKALIIMRKAFERDFAEPDEQTHKAYEDAQHEMLALQKEVLDRMRGEER